MTMPLRVLVVDDNADLRATLRILLGLWGHEAAEAADGPAALNLASAFRPDAVLLNIGLPGLDGYEVARRLRGLPGLRGALIVAVTGYGLAGDDAASRAAGIDHRLLKPFDPVGLERLLADWAARRNGA